MGTNRRAAGGRRAQQMGSKIGRLWLPINTFLGLDNADTADTSLSQGTPTLEPTSGPSELTCIPMTTADEVHTIIPIPWDLDIDQDMAVRVFFAHASTDASDKPVWKVGYKFLGKQDTVPELKAGVDEDISITSPATSSTDDSLEVTAWTRLNTASYIADTDIMMGLTLELDALGSAGADESEVIGIELAYQRLPSDMHFQSIGGFIMENPI